MLLWLALVVAATGKNVVLIGAGHAHLYALRRAADFARARANLTVIAPGPFWYSGLATGMLGGDYSPADDQIDVAALVMTGGGRFLRASATLLDPGRQVVILEGGQEIPYDLLSLNLGSETVPLPGCENRADIYPLKPLENLCRLRSDLEAAGPATRRVVIVGGGASGVEVASNVRALTERLGATSSEVTLLVSGPRLLPQYPTAAARKAARWLEARGVRYRLQTLVERIAGDCVVTSSGERIAFDLLVNATGLRPPALLRESGLATDANGALQVNRYLQSTSDPRIFGGGDCVAFLDRPLPKIGVYAVRQSPVLHANLLSSLEDGSSLRPFRPQRAYLSILNLGSGKGLASWRRFTWCGRAAFRLKDYLDRRFLAHAVARDGVRR